MRHAVKWIAGLVLLLLVTLIVAGVALWRTVTPSSGQARLAGLSAPVTIVRDRHAVAHIEAETFEDAARALGFTHAQERLWQMETLRRTAGGRLSELFGEPALDFDIFLRTLGMDRAAARSVDMLKPETRTILEAYAAGVNAWVNRERERLEPAFPPEFLVFDAGFEPWKPADSVAIIKLMSLQLSMNLKQELQRLELASRGFAPAEIADLLPSHPDDTAPALPNLRELLPLRPVPAVLSADGEEVAALPFLAPPVSQWASNNWVVAGSRTVSGKPLLANDPHLAFGAPSLWYLAHMRWGTDEPRNIIGATLPGTPLVLLGRSDDLAWGFTNAGADVQDIFIERTKPDDPSRYLTPDGWRDFDIRSEVIAVAGAEPVTIEVKSTRHGPVLPDKLPLPADAPMVFSNVLAEHHVAALQWTGLAEDDRSLDALAGFARARTTEELIESLGSIVSPMQAIVIADRAGSIALTTPARLPVRSPSNAVRGRAPVPGWLAAYDWQGTIDARSIPIVRDDGSGAIVTANTRLPNADAVAMTFDWEETVRFDRASELIVGATRLHDVTSMVAAQNDTRSEPMLDLRDRLLALHIPDEPHAAILRNWDGEMDRDARAPLLMVAWARFLTRKALEDDLGPGLARFENVDHFAIRRILGGGARDWCDDRTTQPLETCGDIAASAWDAALVDLVDRYGSDPQDWSWGKAHPVRNAHQPFDTIPVLRRLFSIERPASGGPHTLNRGHTTFSKDEPYAASHGAGYKAVYDLGEPERSLFVQTTGQSGNPFSRHYRSLATTWADGGYISMTTDPQTYREGSLGEWTLRPD